MFAKQSLPGRGAMGFSTLSTRTLILNCQALNWFVGFAHDVFRFTSCRQAERQSLTVTIS
jgi:hypothetical protein